MSSRCFVSLGWVTIHGSPAEIAGKLGSAWPGTAWLGSAEALALGVSCVWLGATDALRLDVGS